MQHVGGGASNRRNEMGSPTAEPVRKGTFIQNGEYWTLSYANKTFSLKGGKGLTYIHFLLQHPGEEIHALDLVNRADPTVPAEQTSPDLSSVLTTVGMSIRDPGDAGEMLDARAKQEYQRRLLELRNELEEARDDDNPEKADTIQSEIDALARELARAVGLGGRDRRSGSAAERARLNVTRAIKAALQRISEHHAQLGELLERTIRTGSFCRYSAADPIHSVSWQFSLEDASYPPPASTAVDLFIRRDASFLHWLASRTRFIGRKNERAILRLCLDQASRGQGTLVMIRGEPGEGKTRIANELAAEAWQAGYLTLTGSCYDRNDCVPFIPFVEILETALARTPTQEGFRNALGNDAGEVARLLPQLRRLFPDIPRPLDLAPEQSRRVLFKAVLDLFGRVAANAPVLLIVEDLQWADEGTLSLLNYLARSISKLPALIVATHRSNDLDPRGLLASTIGDLIRAGLVTAINLSGLPHDAVAEMLQALSERKPPEAVVRAIYSGTEGNPFFVEELFKHLVEQGKLLDSQGEFRRDLQLTEIDLPQSLRLVIGRRLERLRNDTRSLLDTAAVIGRSFTFELLQVSTRTDPDALLDQVEEAEKTGLISSTLDYPDAHFQFSHELIRRYVLGELSALRLQRSHLKVAEAIESLYADTLDDHANDLAYHLLQAGNLADRSKTIRYLEIAARRARMQGALIEAETFYRRALTVLATMTQAPERDQRELALRLALGAVLMATEGYTGAGTAAAYQRAIALGERLGQPMQVVLALAGLSSRPLLQGELEAALMLADRVLAAAQHDGSQRAQIWGYYLQGVVRYHRGDLVLSLERLDLAHKAYSEDDHRKNPQDPGSEALEYLALTSCQLGMTNFARARIREAIILNERLGKPYARTHCQFYAAYLHALMRDPPATWKFSESVLKLAAERSIPLYVDAGRILHGWALAMQGHCDDGVRYAKEGLASYQAAGNRLALGAFLGFLAEAQSESGALDEAIATVEQALNAAPGQLVDVPYLLWVRGNLLVQRADRKRGSEIAGSRYSAALAEAEHSFRDAIVQASRIGARYFALRAANSLGHLLVSIGRSAEVRDLVLPPLHDIEDVCDTVEVADAKMLSEQPN